LNEIVFPSDWHEIDRGYSPLSRVFELNDTAAILDFSYPEGYEMLELDNVHVQNWVGYYGVRGFEAELTAEYVGPAPTLDTACHILLAEGRDSDAGLIFVDTFCEDR